MKIKFNSHHGKSVKLGIAEIIPDKNQLRKTIDIGMINREWYEKLWQEEK